MIGRHSALRIAVPLAAACVMVVSEPVAAFKLETHIWIGQQVLNDVLPDGKVTIEPFGEFTVAPEIVAALRARPREYLSGTMGPDVFPDLAAGQMTVHPGNTAPSDAAAWSTDRWLRHLLDFYSANPQYTAFVYGFLSHAGSDAFAHSYVNTYAGDIFDLTNGETEVELRHVMLEEYIKNKMPPITNAAGTILQPYDIVADPTGDLVTFDLPYHLFYLPDVAEQYRRNPATRYLAEMHDFRLGLYTAQQKVISLGNTINTKISSFEDEIDDLTCSDWMWYVDFAGCLAWEATIRTVSSSLAATRAVNGALVDSVATPLDLWRRNVEAAIREYFRMSERVAIEIMRGGNPRAEIERWVCESAPAFVGLPGVVTRPGCAANRAASDFQNGISSLRSKISDNLGALGWLLDPGQKVNEIVEAAIKPELEDLGVRLSAALLGDDSVVTSLLTYRTMPADAAGLNEVFSADESGTGLLAIGDIAARVDADMYLTADGHIDPARFSAIHDAVVLSKLALLSGAELNRLAALAGVTSTIYGSALYPENAQPLFGVFRSIDGNHQWQEYGIPSPRVDGQSDPKTADDRQYGMPAVRLVTGITTGGFRLWQDCDSRRLVFMSIFSGPLTLGIEDRLAPDDPNHAPEENPFPFAPESRSDCSAGAFLPDVVPIRFPAVHAEVTSPPTLSLPEDVVVEATSGAGAAVSYGGATAADSAGNSVPVACLPASGGVFPLGTTHVSCTAAGISGTVATGTFTVSVVDTTPPVITVGRSAPPNAQGWYNTDVVLTFTAHDAVSQTFNCEMATLRLSGGSPLSVTMRTEGAGQRVKVSCVDQAGNRAFAAPVVNIDKTPPTIQIIGVDASGYVAGCAPTPTFVAADALSGLASSSSALSGGGGNGVGAFTFTVNASDIAGNVATRAASYSVRYDFRGFLPPVANDGSAVFRLGRTVPVKFQLARCDGSIVTNAVATLAVSRLTSAVLGTTEPMDVESAGAANSDNLFRVSDLQYIYNMSTQSLGQGTYQIKAVLDDGTIHGVNVSLKAR